MTHAPNPRTGALVGLRGPWGTTYASDLRRSVATLSEDEWVSTLRERTGLPPMPWMNVRHMAESDMRALYRYIGTLGGPGPELPEAVGPEVEPSTPYISLAPVIPSAQ